MLTTRQNQRQMILNVFIFHFLTLLFATCFTFSNVSVIVALKSKFCRILGRALKIIFNCWGEKGHLNHTSHTALKYTELMYSAVAFYAWDVSLKTWHNSRQDFP
jgi:hypothetical protein